MEFPLKGLCGPISYKDMNFICNTAIKDWHFEMSENGNSVKPVEGTYDASNPKHIKSSDIIKINHNLK